VGHVHRVFVNDREGGGKETVSAVPEREQEWGKKKGGKKGYSIKRGRWDGEEKNVFLISLQRGRKRDLLSPSSKGKKIRRGKALS